MKIIVVIDDNGGMMFNNRRQSQDRLLREHIRTLVKDNKLLMTPYSFQQFQDMENLHIFAHEDFLNIAEAKDYCFVEDKDIYSYIDKMQKLFIYKWNRLYPADVNLDLGFLKNGWNRVSTTEFAGHSHDKITMEEWVRE